MTGSEEYRAKNFNKQKSLGQNFLVDAALLDSIVSSTGICADDILLEIGPGIGFLTERLLPKCRHLFAVELDAAAVKHLKILQANNPNFDFLRGDFLAYDIKDILDSFDQGKVFLEQIQDDQSPKIKITANIPYQITTKILLHLLGEIGESNPNREMISEINILVQREFANRLLAQSGTKAYGAITLFVKYWAAVEKLVDVPKEAFRPVPKVDSTFIKITLRDQPLVDCKQPKKLRRFIKAIFANRRKKLLNGLKAAGYTEDEIAKLELQENLRGETLTLEEIAGLVAKLD